ncbi:nuclear transport factor 2 family protein [Streptomyces sp. RS10V-4]|uniref:nuclear transport factor 2 family protein n=1 Tax=Streptomyces rhizoryzae TaxID=2932493 RepID=UPI002002E5BC|nr:nuclear transport factor 2 family protein [Streptomyces rhizoryzae]MCK7626479.1 nuclear transport factor 2 family protein [Streptomyces rhizoryzae]
MTQRATPTPAPTWVRQLMQEIDTLDFGEGFARTTDDTEMFFGTAHVTGTEAIKAFFIAIDEPLHIEHTILECWDTPDGTLFLRGEATMAKKTDPDTTVQAPFMHLYRLDDNEKIHTIHITAGPLQTDTIM